jgi:hypothetical protein
MNKNSVHLSKGERREEIGGRSERLGDGACPKMKVQIDGPSMVT